MDTTISETSWVGLKKKGGGVKTEYSIEREQGFQPNSQQLKNVLILAVGILKGGKGDKQVHFSGIAPKLLTERQ